MDAKCIHSVMPIKLDITWAVARMRGESSEAPHCRQSQLTVLHAGHCRSATNSIKGATRELSSTQLPRDDELQKMADDRADAQSATLPPLTPRYRARLRA